MKYRVVISGTFQDVFIVEAKSPEDAAKRYEDGDPVDAETFVKKESVWSGLLQEPAPSAKAAPKRKRKRRTKAEIEAAKAARETPED